MGIFSFLNKQSGSAVGEIINGASNILDGLITNKEEKAAVFIEMSKMQVEINKLEASSSSLFKGGWRPFIGWVCGVSLASYYIPQFTIASYLWCKMCLDADKLLPYPEVNADSLFELVLGMLGMAALRQVDKVMNKSK